VLPLLVVLFAPAVESRKVLLVPRLAVVLTFVIGCLAGVSLATGAHPRDHRSGDRHTRSRLSQR